jgi:hypothetical protein
MNAPSTGTPAVNRWFTGSPQGWRSWRLTPPRAAQHTLQAFTPNRITWGCTSRSKSR